MVEVNRTDCCALDQLYISNLSTTRQILQGIKRCDREDRHAAELSQAWYAITLPSEKKAEKTLESLKFKKIAVFPRRPCHISSYSPDRTLNMWFVTREELFPPKKMKK